MSKHTRFNQILACIILALFAILAHQPASALSSADLAASANDAALKLVEFCNEPKGGLDEQALATVVDYVLASKKSREHALPSAHKSTGAYYEFDTRIPFPRFAEYSYNPLIPTVITRPSSVRYSTWAGLRDESQRLVGAWRPIPAGAPPIVIHGSQRESDTPDLNARVYHEYDLKRTLILFNHKDHQVIVSVSKQAGKSDVGKKGGIIGNDNDWSYYYSGVPGSPQTGLGWVKSYIYDSFSVGVYVESGTAPAAVRAGVFSWLSAGWSGINFVKSSHILGGLRRFGQAAKTILESPHLPAPNQIAAVSQWLAHMPASELAKRYAALQQAVRSSAVRAGMISKASSNEQASSSNTPKDQMVEELMLEYLKIALGKPALLGHHFFALPSKPVPLS